MSLTMSRVAFLVSLASGLLAPAVTVWAEESGPMAGSEAAKGANIQDYLAGGERANLESTEYITLDVKDKDLGELLAYIGDRVSVNIIADPTVKEKVSIQFDRVEWRHALDVIAKQTNCKIVEKSERLILFTQPPAISMEFQDADIKVVLDLLAKQSGANIVLASDVQGKISLSLREVPWKEALQTVVETAGYTIVKAQTDSGNEILRVVRPESLIHQLVTEYFALQYIRPADPYTAVISGVEKYTASPFAGQGDSGNLDKASSGGAAGGGSGSQNDPSGFSLEDALRDTISKEGSLKYDNHTNIFIVKDTKPKLDEIREIIRRVDVRPPQLFVEVKFIKTSNADILERGIKFDNPSTPERDGFDVEAYGPAPDSTAADPLFRFGGTFPFDMGRIDRIPTDFRALGLLDFTKTRLLLKLVKDDENSRIVQEPILTMLDNKPATIFVGDEVPFAVQKVSQDQNGNTTVTIEENKRSPINVGFTLYLTPHVIPGTDMISLTVIPKVSTLSGTTSPVKGFERFSFEEGTGTKNIIDLPRQSLQTVVTYLRVHDGHTAVIGGLQSEDKREIETKIPLLSSIPVLGNLFTWRRKDNKIESILILITPHIVKTSGEEDRYMRGAVERQQARDFFYQKYEKPEVKEGEEKAEDKATGEPESETSTTREAGADTQVVR